MFIIKNKYFFIIENIKDIDLKKLKLRNKFFIIYRNYKNMMKSDLLRFRQSCKSKGIKLYVANDIKLAISINSDGIYLSSFNKGLQFLNFKNQILVLVQLIILERLQSKSDRVVV